VLRSPARLVALSALVICVGAGAAVWASSRGSAARPSGPIANGHPSGILVTVRGLGKPFTIGAIELQTPTSAPAQVDGVSLVGASAGMRLVRAYVAEAPGDTGRQGAWAATRDWPPPGETLSPFTERLVEPHSAGSSTSALQVVLELVLSKGRAATFQQVAVTYHIAGKRYRLVWPLAVRACAPGVACHAPSPPSA
jgi:hypothetical protein